MALSGFGRTSAWDPPPDYAPWRSEDYENEMKRLRQLKLDLGARSSALQTPGDAGSYAALQKAAASVDQREAALQARANRDIEALDVSYAQQPGKPTTGLPGDIGRQWYTSWLATNQEAKNIRNVLAGRPRQALNVITSPPSYLTGADEPQERAMPNGSYAALASESTAGMNPTLARAINLARLRGLEAQAETAAAGTPFGQQTARDLAIGDLMSGRTGQIAGAEQSLRDRLAAQAQVAEGERFFSPAGATMRMVKLDEALAPLRAGRIEPARLAGAARVGAAEVQAGGVTERAQLQAISGILQQAIRSWSAIINNPAYTPEDRAKAAEAAQQAQAMLQQMGLGAGGAASPFGTLQGMGGIR